MNLKITNILITGVGGQGLVLATKIISTVAFYEGFDIKTSDVIGLAQRGGLIWGCIRYGENVPSPLIPNGQGDILLAMEKLEALRWTHLLKDNAKIIINDDEIYPNRVLIEREEYPEKIDTTLSEKGYDVKLINAKEISKDLGNVKVSNTVLLGMLSKQLPYDYDSWIKVISESVPANTVEINIKAFDKGRKL
jgi:indolepyruvate ferredoxin oxidoreductase, beta subunit